MKKRIIACVLACAMLLMGSGYAYWTDLINITAKADTGDLNVDFTDARYVRNNFDATAALHDESAYDKTTRSAEFTANDVTLKVNELYPGHYEVFKATVFNEGTVAAKLGKINAVLRGNESDAQNMIGIALDAESEYYVGTWHWPFVERVEGDVELGLPAGSYFEIDGVKFVRLSALPSLDLDIDEQLSNILYLTNLSNMEFTIKIGMDPDADGIYTTGSAQDPSETVLNDSGTENKYKEVTLGLVWDQYNEQ